MATTKNKLSDLTLQELYYAGNIAKELSGILRSDLIAYPDDKIEETRQNLAEVVKKHNEIREEQVKRILAL